MQEQKLKINQIENTHKGSFYLEENKTLLAELTYSFAGPDKLIIDQTKVSYPLKMQRIENSLIEAAVNYARLKNITIVPLCPIAKSIIENRLDCQDVLIKKDLH